MAEKRFVMVQDGDCHWYVIPADRQADWSRWEDLDEDDPASWEAPDWAERVGGAPSLVEFTGYAIK